MMERELCITDTAATVESLLGVPVGGGMSPALSPVLDAAARAFGAKKCDRVFFYNPDAIALWIYERYARRFSPLEERADLSLVLRSVFPPVTPVCFASMYSGLTPERHGIMKYEKPVLTCRTVFDDLPDAGRRAAIISTGKDSMSLIFLGRNVDYFIYDSKKECNAKAMELIYRDEYDFIALYNGDYDHWMHRFGPEGRPSLWALGENIDTWCELHDSIEEHWQGHRTALAFAPDHGCHSKLGLFGTHGDDVLSDMYIRHFYAFL